MCASASFMLGFIHLFFWFKNTDKNRHIYFLSTIMAMSAGINALLELGLLMTTSVDTYNELLRYENLAIFMILIPMIWFVHLYLKTGRTWLAVSITALWSVSIVINFLSPTNLTFSEIYELKQVTSFWGEVFSIPSGEEHPWKILADIASLLILIYVTDASFRKFKQGEYDKSLIIGGSTILFILSAGIHTPLVDAEIIATPYMISFSFLAIVVAFSYQLASDAMQIQDYAHQIVSSENKRVTAEKEVQQTRCELEHLARENLLGELSTTLAHEINQPLSAILNNSYAAQRFLSQQPPNLQEVNEIFEDIIRDNKRASQIILQLRNMLKTGEIVRELYAINDIIEEVINFLKYEISTNHITIKLKLLHENPNVLAGKVELQQVLINLIVNAMKAISDLSEDKKLIVITTQMINKKEVVVSVSDTGKGLFDIDQEKLFDAFYSHNKNKSLGMGLTISQRIIKAHGGSILAGHSSIGGAKFSFTLPLEP